MFKRVLYTISTLTLLLASCSGQQQDLPPTFSPADIQNTAIAAANTMVAQTQMALPTATLVPPPTETPIPSPTPLPTFTPDLAIPTQPIFIQASPTTAFSQSNVGECNGLLAVAEAGPIYPVQIQNTTGGVLTLSLHLSKNEHGQCGFMPGIPLVYSGYTTNIPTGNWYYFALIDYGNGKSGNDYGYFVVRPGGAADIVKIKKR